MWMVYCSSVLAACSAFSTCCYSIAFNFVSTRPPLTLSAPAPSTGVMRVLVFTTTIMVKMVMKMLFAIERRRIRLRLTVLHSLLVMPVIEVFMGVPVDSITQEMLMLLRHLAVSSSPGAANYGGVCLGL